MNEAQTAILLFSRSLEAEFSAKSFGLTKDRFRLLYNALTGRTRNTLKGVDAPVFEFNSRQQVGSDFGERLINALSEVRSKGHQRIIVIGNDAPGLNPGILNAAIERLEQGKNVLGRDARGGCYLMGFDMNDVALQGLLQVQWHSRLVFDQVNDLLAADTSLPQLADLNDKEDLKTALLIRTSPRQLIISLLQLVFSSFFKTLTIGLSIKEVFSGVTRYRGPPSLTFITSY